MSSTNEEYNKFLEWLLSDEVALAKLQAALGGRKLVYRDELTELLEEIKALRNDTNKRFEQMIEENNKRFEQIDKRFEQMIEENNKRFEQIDKRFEQMIEENNKRFEQIDKRFEQIDKRFEDMLTLMDKRFEAVDKRFELMEKRFEAVDKRFELMEKRFEQIDNRFEELIKAMNSKFDFLNTKIDSIGNRSGTLVEKGVIRILREILLKEGLTSSDISKIEKLGIRDKEGKFLYKDAKIDIDGFISNGRTIIMEIKFKPTKEDVQMFFKKKEAFSYYMKKEPEQWLVAVEITESVKELAEDLGMKVIYMKLVEPYLS